MSFKASLFEIMQQEAFITKDQIETGLERLNKYSNCECIAYCWHDRDTLSTGEPKPKHIHIMVRLKNNTTSQHIAKLFGFEDDHFIQKSMFQSYCLMVQYLTHKNDPKKFQYDYDKDVVKVKGDIDTYYKTDLDKITKPGKNDYAIDWTFSERSYIMQHNEIYQFPFKYEKDKIASFKKLDFAYDCHCKNMSYKTGDRNMDIIYITGEPRTGKTNLAKFLAKMKGYDYIVSSSSNDPLQDYKGQKCLILDDFRPNDLKFSDLLKLLDPYTCSSVKSRYSNKYMVDCQMIIITSVLSIKDFALAVKIDNKSSYEEPIEQFYKRVGVYIKVGSTTYSMYQGVDEKGIPVGDSIECPNPTLLFTDKQTNKLFNTLTDLLPKTLEDLQKLNN